MLPALLFLPLVWLFFLSYLEYLETGAGFGVNPDEAFVKYLGEWSIRILLVAYLSLIHISEPTRPY